VDWADREQVTVLFNQIDQAAYQRGAGIVKMEPRVWQVEERGRLEIGDWRLETGDGEMGRPAVGGQRSEMPAAMWAMLCAETGCVTETDTIQPPRTILVDLRPSEEAILAAMKQKTRYNIRLAEKKGVTVRLGTAADLPAFYALMQVTGQRDSFGIHDLAYYRAAYELFAPEQAALIIAEYAGKPLAGVMAFTWGQTAAYLYGASSNEERQRMPTYAAQWEAMRWAKAKGCTTYDLWGIPDAPEAELEARFTEQTGDLWPVYRFKRGFGGEIRRTVGAADRVYNRLLHRLYQWRRGR
jgi:lipid II:glycine glycyltransferase (peptidoglycan interpeptide bridge formation enzyme)